MFYSDVSRKTHRRFVSVWYVLPLGFYFGDERWERIWQRFEEKGDSLTMANLKAPLPDEATVQSPGSETGETFNRRNE